MSVSRRIATTSHRLAALQPHVCSFSAASGPRLIHLRHLLCASPLRLSRGSSTATATVLQKVDNTDFRTAGLRHSFRPFVPSYIATEASFLQNVDDESATKAPASQTSATTPSAERPTPQVHRYGSHSPAEPVHIPELPMVVHCPVCRESARHPPYLCPSMHRPHWLRAQRCLHCNTQGHVLEQCPSRVVVPGTLRAVTSYADLASLIKRAQEPGAPTVVVFFRAQPPCSTGVTPSPNQARERTGSSSLLSARAFSNASASAVVNTACGKVADASYTSVRPSPRTTAYIGRLRSLVPAASLDDLRDMMARAAAAGHGPFVEAIAALAAERTDCVFALCDTSADDFAGMPPATAGEAAGAAADASTSMPFTRRLLQEGVLTGDAAVESLDSLYTRSLRVSIFCHSQRVVELPTSAIAKVRTGVEYVRRYVAYNADGSIPAIAENDLSRWSVLGRRDAGYSRE
eukprot:TRINITY_DN44822_c0_g1_i1.p1 TRINITY_DN44822_c0_g1~~TRINITY_DN44822_c0_g1_i1.p1  ORF type:complete len:461 (-),score=68.52 TRINITY_DN44822_c0_g1_i1:323-1705(-)